MMLWGYFLKLVIAERIAIFVNAVYDQNLGGVYAIVATLLYGIQIYCDFAGYSGNNCREKGQKQRIPQKIPLRLRFLAQMAQIPGRMVQRLSLYSAGREPQGQDQEIYEYHGRISGQRYLARKRMEISDLGRTERILPSAYMRTYRF